MREETPARASPDRRCGRAAAGRVGGSVGVAAAAGELIGELQWSRTLSGAEICRPANVAQADFMF